MRIKLSNSINVLASVILLFSASTYVYAKSSIFHSPYFDISLAENLKLTSKTEEKSHSFYRYVFNSSSSNGTDLEMRIIVSNKKPEKNQSLEDFQLKVVSAMSTMFMDSYRLYSYLNTPENQKVLGGKLNQFNLGGTTFAGVTLYFGSIDASFLVTNSHNMTYAFTLVSSNTNKQIRENNLKMLTNQLQSIKFNSIVTGE